MASLFERLHQAEFYVGLHEAAAATLPQGEGQSWLDVGCGPGVLARIAAAKGYEVRATDKSARMIASAQAWPGPPRRITYAVGDLASEARRPERFEVVSASSLLVVLPNPVEGLLQLASLLKPGGKLLIIEAAPTMGRSKALRLFLGGALGPGGALLPLWAMARSGRCLPDSLFHAWPEGRLRRPLLSGLAVCWVLDAPPPQHLARPAG